MQTITLRPAATTEAWWGGSRSTRCREPGTNPSTPLRMNVAGPTVVLSPSASDRALVSALMSSLPVSTAPTSWSGSLAAAAAGVSHAARELGTSRWASTVRAWCVPYLFHGMESVFKSGEDPTVGLETVFAQLTAYLQASRGSGMAELVAMTASASDAAVPVEKVTGEHYGRLFREFDAQSF